MAKVEIIKEVATGDPSVTNNWELCFHWAKYKYDNGDSQHGYRFMWRHPTSGYLQPARGQARLPSLKMANSLIQKAIDEGWGHYDADVL